MGIVAVFQQLGWGELVIVLFIVLLLFGAKRLPEIARSMGKASKEFRDATKGLADDVKSGLEDDERPASAEPRERERTKDE